MRFVKFLIATAALALCVQAHAQVKLTLWSHWAAEKIKRDYVEDAIKRFEAANPGVKVEAQWYEKTALYAALKTALRAGTAPDIFYAEPDQVEYMENALLLDLSALNWAAVEPWAKEIWSYKASRTACRSRPGRSRCTTTRKPCPTSASRCPATFNSTLPSAMWRKRRAKNMTPMSLGVGDRPFPGAHLTHEALLKKLGVQEYDNLLKGKLERPAGGGNAARGARLGRGRTAANDLHHAQARRGAYLLPHQPRRRHVPERKLVHLARVQPAGQGRPAAQFPARRDEVPDRAGRGMQRVPDHRGRRKLRRERRHQEPEAGDRVPELFRYARDGEPLARERARADGDQGRLLEDRGPHAGYFKELGATSQGAKYYFGLPIQVMQGKQKEVFTQVFNNAFPAGTISVDEAVKQMNAAYGKH